MGSYSVLGMGTFRFLGSYLSSLSVEAIIRLRETYKGLLERRKKFL